GIRAKLVTGVQTCALPIFAPDGKIMAVLVDAGGATLESGIPVALFQPRMLVVSVQCGETQYDVTRGEIAADWMPHFLAPQFVARSEERRVGKEWVVRWSWG